MFTVNFLLHLIMENLADKENRIICCLLVCKKMYSPLQDCFECDNIADAVAKSLHFLNLFLSDWEIQILYVVKIQIETFWVEQINSFHHLALSIYSPHTCGIDVLYMLKYNQTFWHMSLSWAWWKLVKIMSIFYHFRPCKCISKHACAGQNIQHAITHILTFQTACKMMSRWCIVACSVSTKKAIALRVNNSLLLQYQILEKLVT